MKAELINIGDELLIGQVVNTNAAWVGEQLNLAGIELLRVNIIPDNKEDILNILEESGERVDIMLITGGLGPTKDDITKQTLCDYFGTRLIFHQPSYDNIKKLFGHRGIKIREINRKQAEIPENCIPIINENGTAPGMWFEKGSKIYVSMPGVPYEMKPMVMDFILPRLAEKFNLPVILHKTILTQGAGESMIAELLEDWEDGLPSSVKLSYLPQPGMVRLRLTVRGSDKKGAKSILERKIKELQQIIPELIFGYNEDTLEQVVGELLKERGKTLSTAESCTGGYISHLITTIPGSSQYFTGAVIAYDNKIKTDFLGVKQTTLDKHGAVSEETVREMARGIRELYGTDCAIAVSGIAGPEGGTQEKPVGTTCIAIIIDEKIISRKFQFSSNRERNIRVAGITALNMLRKGLGF